MEIHVQSPGGLLVDARFADFKITTDQPVVLFGKERYLTAKGIALKMTNDWNDQSHLAENIAIEITLPADFPEKYRRAVVRAAGMCTVKRHIEKPPAFVITARNGHPG